MVLPLLAGRRFQVLFHSPHRGAFHLSLTVLVHYRSSGSIQPWKMVLPDSDRVPRVPSYSGAVRAASDFGYRAFTFSGRSFRIVLLSSHGSLMTVLQPRISENTRFGLLPVRSPLLRESLLISFPRVTEMFQFTRFAPYTYVFSVQCPDITRDGFPHSDISGS